MPKKNTVASDPIVSSGAKPARARKHAPAKRSTNPAVESSPSTEAEAVAKAPTFEEISQLAYSYWESRGYQGGSPEEDWLRAERELRSDLVIA